MGFAEAPQLEQPAYWFTPRPSGADVTSHETPPEGMHAGSELHINPDGDAGGWVEPDAIVSEGVTLSVDAQVSGDARVFGNAQVLGAVRISDDSLVHGNAILSGDVRMTGQSGAWA
jgi:cytoskeletal protein CcmA (bactofilin family)